MLALRKFIINLKIEQMLKFIKSRKQQCNIPIVIASDINMLWKADKVVSIIHNNKDIYYIGKDYKHEFYITKTKIDNPVRIVYPNHLL